MKAAETPIDSIFPYERNPRDNSKSVDRVAESIKAFGFLQPIVCDRDGVILAGHTRYEAAKKLGLKTVPVLTAADLTPAQAKAYRLADNKVGESSLWLEDVLAGELEAISAEDLAFDPSDFGFDTSKEYRKKKAWETAGKKCDMTPKITVRTKCGYFYTCFFSTGKNGRSIEDIKTDRSLVRPFADCLCDFLERSVGTNLASGGWCICTTPRRRHKDGFHFSTAVCETAAGDLGIRFYPDAVTASNRGRIDTDFTLAADPSEPNIILYDDVLSTGITMRDTRLLFTEAGHNVLPVAAIRNQ